MTVAREVSSVSAGDAHERPAGLETRSPGTCLVIGGHGEVARLAEDSRPRPGWGKRLFS
jgi:hypothetical protein